MKNTKSLKIWDEQNAGLSINWFAGYCFGDFYRKFLFQKSLHTVMKAPEFVLTDQNNKRISNKDMLGKVYVVEFFYARCPTICPVMNSNLKFVDRR
jgi:protein SCO1/2